MNLLSVRDWILLAFFFMAYAHIVRLYPDGTHRPTPKVQTVRVLLVSAMLCLAIAMLVWMFGYEGLFL